MRRFSLLAAVGTFWLTSAGSATSAADITYVLHDQVGVGLVTGTITTDGASGTLFNGDILSWDLTVFDGTGTATLNSEVNSTVFISGGSTTATPADLLFNFNGSGAFLNFNGPSPGCPPQWVLRTDRGTSCNGTSGDAMGVSAVLPEGSGVSVAKSGNTVFATVIPEPASVALMVAGLISLIGLRKRHF